MYRARRDAADQCAGAGVQHASVIATARYNIVAPRGTSRSLPWGAVVRTASDQRRRPAPESSANSLFPLEVTCKVDGEIIHLLNDVIDGVNQIEKKQGCVLRSSRVEDAAQSDPFSNYVDGFFDVICQGLSRRGLKLRAKFNSRARKAHPTHGDRLFFYLELPRRLTIYTKLLSFAIDRIIIIISLPLPFPSY